VKDLNTTVTQVMGSSNPTDFQGFGDAVYFKATTPPTGTELYRYANGAVQLLRDIAPPYYYSAVPSRLYDVGNGRLVFDADDGTHGRELWVTDGTTDGTVILKDINPGGSGVMDGGRTPYNGRFYFMANDGAHGTEPWVSDGTADGTQLFADLNPGSASSNCSAMTVLGGKLALFVDGALWMSDGSAAGTSLVTPIGQMTTFLVAGSKLFFVANSAISGNELWVTDGTAAGTRMLADIAPGAWSGLAANASMVAVGDTLYFAAASDATGFDLWKTDGTPAGTQFVTPLSESLLPLPGPFIATGAVFCFSIGDQLWRSDGTAGGTYIIDAVTSYGPTAAFGRVFYRRGLSNGIDMLMSTDGVTTAVVRSDRGFQPSRFTEAGGKLFFAAFDALAGFEPWVSDDGTGATTRRLANLAADTAPSSNPHQLTPAGDKLFFCATQTRSAELWRTDGTADGTVQLSYFSDGIASQPILNFVTAWRSNVYFSFANALWRSTGVPEGTAAFKTLNVSWMFPTDEYLYMSATQNYPPTLYRTDGTDAGTIPLRNEQLADDGPVAPSNATSFAGRVYVRTSYPDSSIWVSAGTVATTKRLLRNPSGGYYYGGGGPMAGAPGGVFYAGTDNVHGTELWRTDGRPGGESIVKDIYPGSLGYGPGNLIPGGRFVYFDALDPVNGDELWRSDGTEAGTILLRDIFPGFEGSNVTSLTAASKLVYFTANDGLHGSELWQTDGTAAGTTMVADIATGAASSSPHGLRFANGRLWFAANDGVHGVELWSVVEGATPSLVADLAPGTASSDPAEIVQAGNLLYFTASTDVGNELWAVPLTESAVSINDTRVSEGNGTAIAHFTVTRTAPTDNTVTVSYATSNMAATAGSDYVAQSGVVTFAPGETSKTIDVSILSDTTPEPDETFVVTLSSPLNAVLDRAVGVADIEDDDHRVALSITSLPAASFYSGFRAFRITNAGPSVASDLRLTYSESPYVYTFSVGSRNITANPFSMSLDPLVPGASVDVSIQPIQYGASIDPANPPGHTVTASVSAAEPESDLSDNTTASMRGASGRLVLPPWLVSGTTATATYTVPSSIDTIFETLTSSDPNVAISPATVTIPPGQTSASFTLTIGNGTGRVRLTLSGNTNADTFVVPVVAPGVTPKLDVAISTGNTDQSYFQPVTIPVLIAALRHDGTLPTGTVTLRDIDSGTTIGQQALDSTGATTFVMTGLPAGQYNYKIDYNGDANFNPLSDIQIGIHVRGYPTTIGIPFLPALVCAGTTLSFSAGVYPPYYTDRAPGSLTATIGAKSYTVALTPGVGNEARAAFTHTFAVGDNTISFFYPGSGPYEPSRRSLGVFVQPCQPMGLVARSGPSGVSVQWNAVPGASYYEVNRYTYTNGFAPPQWFNVRRQPETIWIDPGYAYSGGAGAYLYSVRAVDSNGNTIAFSPPDLAVVPQFADDPLTPGSSVVRASHIAQLLNASYALQRLAGNGGSFPPSGPPSGLPINTLFFADLRTMINNSRFQLGLPAFVFTSAPPVKGDPIRAIDIQQLRDAMN
jgi:ELWxxDGT repeat protein